MASAEPEGQMWVRTIKITFANELMKNSVRAYMSDTVDLTEGMLLVYRGHRREIS